MKPNGKVQKRNGKNAAFSAGRATRENVAKATRVTFGVVASFMRGCFTRAKA